MMLRAICEIKNNQEGFLTQILSSVLEMVWCLRKIKYCFLNLADQLSLHGNGHDQLWTGWIFRNDKQQRGLNTNWMSSILKLVRTPLNYRVLGTRTAAIFLSKWSFSLCTYIHRMNVMLDFICVGTSWHAKCASNATNYKMKNSCPQCDSNRQPWYLLSDDLPTELRGLCWKLIYQNGLYT